MNKVKATELTKWLLSHGVSSITTDDIASVLAIPKNQVSQRLSSHKKRGDMVMIASGLWSPVPPEYSTWGAPPATEIIDAMMRHLNVDYYVGWLSAASLHGASHHAPQVFQVAVSRSLREKEIGRSRFCFYHRSNVNHIPTITIETRSGIVSVSSREATMLDIASDIMIVGGIDNAANLIIELCDAKAPDLNLVNELSSYFPASAIRRLGFIMENFTDINGLDNLKAACDNRKAALSLLDPLSNSGGRIDKKWKLKINKEVQPDI